MYWKNVNICDLKKAIITTFAKREYKGNLLETFEIIKNSSILATRWKSYSRKYDYANNISYNEIILILEKILQEIENITIKA